MPAVWEGKSTPQPFVPVLALVSLMTDLALTQWHEVVFHDGNGWRGYAGGTMFKEGESVVRWIYTGEVLP